MGHLVLYIGLLARRVFLLPRQFDNGSIEIIKRRERVGDQAKPGIIIITSTGRGCRLLEKKPSFCTLDLIILKIQKINTNTVRLDDSAFAW